MLCRVAFLVRHAVAGVVGLHIGAVGLSTLLVVLTCLRAMVFFPFWSLLPPIFAVLDSQELRVLIQSTKNEKQAEQHAEVEQEEHDPQQYGQPQLMPMDPHAAAAAAHYGNYAHQSVDQDGGY